MTWDQQPLAGVPNEFVVPRNQLAGKREWSKADRILGTVSFSDLQSEHVKHGDKNRVTRPSPLRAPEALSMKPSVYTPAPIPSFDRKQSRQHLRMRASSPLLGREYQHQGPSVSCYRSQKETNGTGSLNTRNSCIRDSTANPTAWAEHAVKKNNPREKDQVQTWMEETKNIKSKEPRATGKDSKRKLRPPRIDLSLLFPKPRPSTAPLLSPHRMTRSPSHASFSLEAHSPSPSGLDEDTPVASQLASQVGHGSSDQALLGQLNSEKNSWSEDPLERAVRTSEFDLALDRYEEQQRILSQSTDRVTSREGSHSPPGGLNKGKHLSTSCHTSHLQNRTSLTPGVWRKERSTRLPLNSRFVLERSRKSVLQTSDLHSSSVLCLSSSEDEDDEEEKGGEELTRRMPDPNNPTRKSATVYSDFDPETFVTSATRPTRPTTMKRANRSASGNGRLHHPNNDQSQTRDPPQPSVAKAPGITRKTNYRRASEVPMSASSNIDQSDRSYQRDQLLSVRELKRRSRVMAVTRQEEHLLEAMRRRNGKITPSLFREASPSVADSEERFVLTVPSHDSFYSSDMSFLRLNSGPPSLAAARSAANSGTEPTFQGTCSDVERKTIDSLASPRASLVYSESVPSPAASITAPLTPVLPIHRFSPLPANKPPSRLPPPLPDLQGQKRHTRRRTDSSEAIALDDMSDNKTVEGLPVWALGLDNSKGVAAVR